MNTLNLLITSLHFLSLLTLTTIQKPKIKKIVGVNGHPLVQEAYQGNQKLQLKLLKDLKINNYRIDIPLKTKYSANEKNQHSKIFKYFTGSGVNLVPVLINSEDITGLSKDELYNQGYNQGQLFAKTWSKFFKYYEIENEVDNKTILGPQFSGEDINQYDQTKIKIQLSYLSGLVHGIKNTYPSAITIVNFSYLHTGYLKILNSNHISYDIIGWHWYSDMGNLYSLNGFIKNIAKTFKKKILVTEFNVRKTDSSLLKKDEILWWTNNFRFLVKNNAIKGIFIYELFDEPAFNDTNSKYNIPVEANYGLVSWNYRYFKYQYKPLYYLVKKQIQTTNN